MKKDLLDALVEWADAVDVLICEQRVYIDPTLNSWGGYDDDELAAMLRSAVRAREDCKAEVYYCKFIPPAVSMKGRSSKSRLAIYVDAQHCLILPTSEEFDRIVDKELDLRTINAPSPLLSAYEIERVLANWIDRSLSDIGQLPSGVHPSEWAAAQFLEWWRGSVEPLLQRTEEAVGWLRKASHAEYKLGLVENALAELRASVVMRPETREP